MLQWAAHILFLLTVAVASTQWWCVRS